VVSGQTCQNRDNFQLTDHPRIGREPGSAGRSRTGSGPAHCGLRLFSSKFARGFLALKGVHGADLGGDAPLEAPARERSARRAGASRFCAIPFACRRSASLKTGGIYPGPLERLRGSMTRFRRGWWGGSPVTQLKQRREPGRGAVGDLFVDPAPWRAQFFDVTVLGGVKSTAFLQALRARMDQQGTVGRDRQTRARVKRAKLPVPPGRQPPTNVSEGGA